MVVIDEWPLDVLAPRDQSWFPMGQVDDGGSSLSGFQQIGRIDGGPRWGCRLIRIPLKCREEILAFQAIESILAGGTTPIIMHRYPGDRSPAQRQPSGVPHSDGTPFSDETLYSGPTVSAITQADAALNDSEIVIKLVGGRPIVGGEDFGILHVDASWRTYRIQRVFPEGDNLRLVIDPVLREAVPAGAVVDFDDPRCVMRLANAEAFRAVLEYNRWGYIDGEFEEAFW